MSLKLTEEKFEAHIEKGLNKAGYVSIANTEYDKDLCLIKSELLHFIKSTQQDKWQTLTEAYGDAVEKKVLAKIASEVRKRGVVDVLQNKVKDKMVELELYYPQPRSGMNPDAHNLYKQNKFSLVRQLHFSQSYAPSIDMGLFINGLPIATIELKNLTSGQGIKNAEKQYKDREYQKEPIFDFKRCLVHFCADNDQVSMSTQIKGSKTVFLPFNCDLPNPPIHGDYRISYLWKEVLTPDALLDIIENFVHLSKSGKNKTKELLVFPRYHQLELIKKLRKQLIEDGVGNNYLVQHSTGSGKSYSIGWLTHMLASFYRNDTDDKPLFNSIIIVTDRRVLDDQLKQTIKSLDKVGGTVTAIKSGKDLSAALAKGKRIIVTTIQKFGHTVVATADKKDSKFAVIIDEAHSSQSGELTKEMQKALRNKGVEGADVDDFIMAEIEARGKQQHISYFGFTGTPKVKTLEMFGTKNADGQFVPYHTYSMRQSIKEKFTLDVLKSYTTFQRYFKLSDIPSDKDKIAPSSKTKSKIMRIVDSDPKNIQAKTKVILDHWINVGSKAIKGQARGMIVTSSRKQCVLYFNEINKQLEERGIHYRCLVAFSDDVTVAGGEGKHTESSLNASLGENISNIPAALKESKYRLIVIANKFQTGFDEPLLQSMYIDKKLEGVQCVQTLSRLNRTAEHKKGTFILDFANDIEDIRKAFQSFYQGTILSEASDYSKLKVLKGELAEFVLYTSEDINRYCAEYYKAVTENESRDEGALNAILDKIVERYNGKDDESQKVFKGKAGAYVDGYSYMSHVMPAEEQDIDLEKLFVFLCNLLSKLPRGAEDNIDISDLVDVENLHLKKYKNKHAELEEDSVVMDPPNFDYEDALKTNEEWLSELVKNINKKYQGDNLSGGQKNCIDIIMNNMRNDQELKDIMSSSNSRSDKESAFHDKFNEELIMNIENEDQKSLYIKLRDNEGLRGFISNMLLARYNQLQQVG